MIGFNDFFDGWRNCSQEFIREKDVLTVVFFELVIQHFHMISNDKEFLWILKNCFQNIMDYFDCHFFCFLTPRFVLIIGLIYESLNQFNLVKDINELLGNTKKISFTPVSFNAGEMLLAFNHMIAGSILFSYLNIFFNSANVILKRLEFVQ